MQQPDYGVTDSLMRVARLEQYSYSIKPDAAAHLYCVANQGSAI